MQTGALKGSHLSLQQARLWSLLQRSHAYHAQCVVLLEGRLRTKVLRDELQHMVKRHEILHTVFYRIPGMDEPMQVVAEDAELAYQEVSLEQLSSASQMAQL